MTAVIGVEVWLVDLARDGARLAAMAEARGLLDAADRARHGSYRDPADAEAFAASRAALDLVLSQNADKPLERIRRARSGKPFASGLPMFSLAHTAGHAVVAVAADGAIGVDIERDGDRDPRHALIERIADLLPPAERPLLVAWTVAEAWAKFHGMRLADLLDSTGQGRALEEAMASIGPPILANLPLPRPLVGCCWHMMAGTTPVVRPLEIPA